MQPVMWVLAEKDLNSCHFTGLNMIENILIKKVASYDNEGIQLSDLKKINFIYGANGSGKTTISKLLSDQDNPESKDCDLQWKHGQALNSLVYNKEFREKSFGKVWCFCR